MAKYRDYYSLSSPWYWVLQICLTLYGMGVFAYLVVVQNIHVPDTVFQSLPGGTYYSARYITFVWFAIMFSAAKVFMYPVANAAVLFRGSRGCSIFWYIFVIALTMIHVVVIVGLGDQYGKCNQPGQKDNLCNDPLYCCAPEIYGASSNGCPNSVACAGLTTPVTSVSQLGVSIDFLWLFWVNFAYLFIDILIMFFFGAVFGCCPAYEIRDDDENDPMPDDIKNTDNEEGEEEEDKPEKKGPVTAPALAKSNIAARTLSPTRKSTMKRAAVLK